MATTRGNISDRNHIVGGFQDLPCCDCADPAQHAMVFLIGVEVFGHGHDVNF
eukprot:gene5120-biopygen9015